MKKFLKILITLIILGILGILIYQFRTPLSEKFAPAISNIKNNLGTILPQPPPCSEPIKYTLGTFDTQFGISKDYFLSALTNAEAIWEKPLGKDFFTYVPDDSSTDTVKVNLIYDYRQQATGKLASLGIVVSDNRASYDSLKTRFTALQTQYNTEKGVFNTEVNTFNQNQKDYETQVNYWNSKGGALPADYDKLQTQKAALQIESLNLQTEQNKINALADEINALVVALNRLVSVLNLSVNNYNATVDSSSSESFEEGVYVSDGTTKYINIYEFSNKEKLVRALAHELGHALGLDHVEDPNAIMYKLNQGSNLALTQADINELKTKCQIK